MAGQAQWNAGDSRTNNLLEQDNAAEVQSGDVNLPARNTPWAADWQPGQQEQGSGSKEKMVVKTGYNLTSVCWVNFHSNLADGYALATTSSGCWLLLLVKFYRIIAEQL